MIMKKIFVKGLEPQSSFIKVINYIILCIAVIIIIVPLLILFNISFKTNQEFVNTGIFQFPSNLMNLANYMNAFVRGELLLGFRNVGIIAIVTITLGVMMGAMVAYVIARFKSTFTKTVLGLFTVVMFIPTVTTQVATMTVIKWLHLYNTLYAGMFIYLGVGYEVAMVIFIFLQFIEKIPGELDESALIDGASYFQIFTKIILPNMKPAIVTVIMLKVLTIYNDFFTPYIYMPSNDLVTVTTGLYRFSGAQNTQWNIIAAGVILVMLPTLILYIFLQKHIISNTTEGAIK
jgi:raffinose/stachyose/melibiose transport system permease protein